MARDFYYDYHALRDADIPAWHASFFWPVARETTTGIALATVAEWCRLLEGLGDSFAGDCCCIAIQVPGLFTRALNHFTAVERLRRGGYAVRHSDKLVLVPQFLRPGEPMRFAPGRLPAAPANGTAKQRLKLFLYSLWYNRRKAHKFLSHGDLSRCVTAFDSGNVIFRPFSRNHPDWVRVFSPQEWHGAAGEPPVGVAAAFRDVAAAYVAFAAAYARDVLDVDLPPTLRQALARYAEETLAGIARGYAGLLPLMARLKPRRMLTPTAGNPFTRAASLAVRRQGGHVTGFPHGYYICHYSSPRPAFHELATVDAFMAYTPGSVPLMRRNMATNPPPRGNRVEFLHENSTLFRDQWREWSARPLPERIRTVMVLELELIPEWAGYYCADGMVNYHFYYAVCRQLADAGYDVIFKKRPKSVGWEGCDILKDIPRLRVETRPFEAPGVLDAADAVLLQYGMSSTLHWSMCSNKTVIFADAGWEPWYPEVYAKMARRCRVLPCGYDEQGRATYRWEYLLGAVDAPPTPPDTAYLEDYLFPEEGN
jgi:hypothetical protein